MFQREKDGFFFTSVGAEGATDQWISIGTLPDSSILGAGHYCLFRGEPDQAIALLERALAALRPEPMLGKPITWAEHRRISEDGP